jgi:hypothetical protein
VGSSECEIRIQGLGLRGCGFNIWGSEMLLDHASVTAYHVALRVLYIRVSSRG